MARIDVNSTTPVLIPSNSTGLENQPGLNGFVPCKRSRKVGKTYPPLIEEKTA